MATFNFDASTVAPTASFAPIPAGMYLAHITDSDLVPTKDGSGNMLKLTFEILDGQFKGRKIWNKLNVQNQNQDTMKWALADLSAICHATGNIKLQDSAALHFKPLKIKVVIGEAKGVYEARNNIKGYESASGAMPNPASFAAPAANQTIAAPATNAPAWARKAA